MAEKPKYIADGFEQDLLKLLNAFVQKADPKFPVFGAIWRENHYSLLFMGRPDAVELAEFTNEMFRITTMYLSASTFLQRIGAVYTLYCLFRSQISKPPIKIRMEISHFLIIKELLKEAINQKIRTLHYVIEYLMKNAFLYVAHQTVKSPLMGSMHKESKNSEEIANLKAEYKSDLKEFSINSNLTELRDLDKEYLEAKKKISGLVENLCLEDQTPVYDSIRQEIQNLVDPEAASNMPDSLGSRRAKIREAAFASQCLDRYGQVIEDDNADEDDSQFSPRRARKARRLPKEQRKLGRPSKVPKPEVPDEPSSDEEEIDISHLLLQQNDFYLPPEDDGKKMKSKPGRFYYKTSPKRNTNDDENDVC